MKMNVMIMKIMFVFGIIAAGTFVSAQDVTKVLENCCSSFDAKSPSCLPAVEALPTCRGKLKKFEDAKKGRKSILQSVFQYEQPDIIHYALDDESLDFLSGYNPNYVTNDGNPVMPFFAELMKESMSWTNFHSNAPECTSSRFAWHFSDHHAKYGVNIFPGSTNAFAPHMLSYPNLFENQTESEQPFLGTTFYTKPNKLAFENGDRIDTDNFVPLQDYMRENGYFVANQNKDDTGVGAIDRIQAHADYYNAITMNEAALSSYSFVKEAYELAGDQAIFFKMNDFTGHQSSLTETATRNQLKLEDYPQYSNLLDSLVGDDRIYPNVTSMRTWMLQKALTNAKSDQHLYNVVEQIKKHGRWNKTVLVVTGDHGAFTPYGKMTMMGMSTRVPLVIYMGEDLPLPQGYERGGQTAQINDFLDFYPTYRALGGILAPLPDHVTGVPIMTPSSVLSGKEATFSTGPFGLHVGDYIFKITTPEFDYIEDRFIEVNDLPYELLPYSLGRRTNVQYSYIQSNTDMVDVTEIDVNDPSTYDGILDWYALFKRGELKRSSHLLLWEPTRTWYLFHSNVDSNGIYDFTHKNDLIPLEDEDSIRPRDFLKNFLIETGTTTNSDVKESLAKLMEEFIDSMSIKYKGRTVNFLRKRAFPYANLLYSRRDTDGLPYVRDLFGQTPLEEPEAFLSFDFEGDDDSKFLQGAIYPRIKRDNVYGVWALIEKPVNIPESPEELVKLDSLAVDVNVRGLVQKVGLYKQNSIEDVENYVIDVLQKYNDKNGKGLTMSEEEIERFYEHVALGPYSGEPLYTSDPTLPIGYNNGDVPPTVAIFACTKQSDTTVLCDEIAQMAYLQSTSNGEFYPRWFFEDEVMRPENDVIYTEEGYSTILNAGLYGTIFEWDPSAYRWAGTSTFVLPTVGILLPASVTTTFIDFSKVIWTQINHGDCIRIDNSTVYSTLAYKTEQYGSWDSKVEFLDLSTYQISKATSTDTEYKYVWGKNAPNSPLSSFVGEVETGDPIEEDVLELVLATADANGISEDLLVLLGILSLANP